MPNVGPCEGCRMQVKTFCPRCAPRACDRPTMVVDLPSPNGVGVIAVTSMYLPFGRLARRSRTSRCTLALYGPNISNSLGLKPTSSAICRIGLSLQACAMSMSLGTGVRSFNLVGTNLTAFLALLPVGDLAFAFALALARTGFAVLTAIVSLLRNGFQIWWSTLLPLYPTRQSLCSKVANVTMGDDRRHSMPGHERSLGLLDRLIFPCFEVNDKGISIYRRCYPDSGRLNSIPDQFAR